MKQPLLLLVCLFQISLTASGQVDDGNGKYADSLQLLLKTGFYCGNKNISTLDSIRQKPPFNRIKKIELISFKMHQFDPREIDRSKIKESHFVTPELSDKLLDVLVNYRMSEEETVFCYGPRNAILFLDEKDQVIAITVLCFECSTSFDRIGAGFFLGTNCPEKWRLLRFFFIASGITYGVLPNVADSDDDEESKVDTDRIHNFAQESARPSKGMEEYRRWLYKNLRYPESAKKTRKEGKTIVKFVVEKDGSLSNVEILRGFDPDCDKEALRVISISPKWKPGKQFGEEIRQAYVMPVVFALP